MQKRFGFALLVAVLMASAASAASPRTTTAVAEVRPGRPGYQLFAVVEPVQTLILRAAATGRLADFRLRPGDHVHRDERLGRLRGSTYTAAVASAKAEATAARRTRTLARDRLRATKARYPVLSDRGALDRAKLEAVAADANLAKARARLAALTAAGIVAAPVAGTVAAVLRANGERVAAGDALARIEPAGVLWLRGAVYGKTVAAVRIGTRGTFVPAGGGKAVAVRVTSLIPDAVPDGLGLGLVAMRRPAPWFSGEGGLVTLEAPPRREPAVPTSALILNRGKWWVIKQVGATFKAVRVQPDGTHGGWTWIASGVNAGDRIVTTNAYLVFHRAFAEKYANED